MDLSTINTVLIASITPYFLEKQDFWFAPTPNEHKLYLFAKQNARYGVGV